MEVGKVAVALVQIEAVADEELVGDGEADVADRQVFDEPAVRAVEERRGGQGSGLSQRQCLAELVDGEPGVDDVLDDQDVPAGDLGVEVLEQADARMAALIGAGCVARQLEEVEAGRDAQRAGEVGDEDDARLQRGNEKRLEPFVVARDVTPELADARLQLLAREVDRAEARAAAYEASSSRYRSARRSMSRL